jgi:hypothetical protein
VVHDQPLAAHQHKQTTVAEPAADRRQLKAETLYKVIAVLLVVIAGALFFAHDATVGATLLSGTAQLVAGVSLVPSSA